MSSAPSRAARRRQRQLAALRTPSTYSPEIDVLVASRGGTDHFHEWVHCLDHSATAYGHLHDWHTLIMARGWSRLCADFRKRGWHLPCPLEQMFDEHGAVAAVQAVGCDQADTVQVAERLALAAYSHDVLAGLLESLGGLPPLAAQAKVTAASGLGLLERLCELDATLAEASHLLEGLPVWQVPQAQSPQVRWSAGEGPALHPEIGARALLEGRALHVEGALHADPNAAVVSAIEAGQFDYVLAPMLVSDCLSGMGKVVQGELFGTFMALSDLALMTPVVPPYDTLRHGRRYRDVHPGYRFAALLEVLPVVGPYAQGMDPFDYQQQFSDRLGWPATREMLALGATIDSPYRRFQRHRQCCERKLAQPELFFLGGVPGDAAAFDALAREVAPLECVVEHDGSVTPLLGDLNAESLIERVAESYLFDLGEAIMCNGNPLDAAFGWMRPFDSRVRTDDGTQLRALLQEMLVKDVEFTAVAALDETP